MEENEVKLIITIIIISISVKQVIEAPQGQNAAEIREVSDKLQALQVIINNTHII